MNQALIDELLNSPDVFPRLENMSDSAVRLMGVRGFDQFAKTLRAELDPPRFCGFCLYSHELDLCPQMNGRWWLRKNEFQKAPTGHMSLIVPRRHLTNVLEMTPEDDIAIGGLFRFAVSKFGLDGGATNARFGNPRFNAGSMAHYHINLGKPESMYKEWREPFSKDYADRVTNYERLRKHLAELAERGGFDWALSEEGVAATRG